MIKQIKECLKLGASLDWVGDEFPRFTERQLEKLDDKINDLRRQERDAFRWENGERLSVVLNMIENYTIENYY